MRALKIWRGILLGILAVLTGPLSWYMFMALYYDEFNHYSNGFDVFPMPLWLAFFLWWAALLLFITLTVIKKAIEEMERSMLLWERRQRN